jgi:mxaA protein
MRRGCGRVAGTFSWVIAWSGMAFGANAPHAVTETENAEVATVRQPRPFGHVLGDVIVQRVLLERGGERFTPAELPGSQRINVWFERRTPQIETAPDGKRWLLVEYQIINTPQILESVTLPAWTLQSGAGTRLAIPEWQVDIAALTPVATAPRVTGALRPDHPAPTIDTTPIARQLIAWTAAFLLVVAAWFGWVQQRNRRDRADKPFARAWHEVKQFDENAPEAWQALHRAFDRAAGRVVQPETLPHLFAQAPYLCDLRARIEQFFQQSSERFFGGTMPQQPLSVRTLCRELQRIEKRCTS